MYSDLDEISFNGGDTELFTSYRTVPIPVSAPASAPYLDQKKHFQAKIFVKNLAFLMLIEALLPRNLSSVSVRTFVIHFITDPVPEPYPKPEP